MSMNKMILIGVCIVLVGAVGMWYAFFGLPEDTESTASNTNVAGVNTNTTNSVANTNVSANVNTNTVGVPANVNSVTNINATTKQYTNKKHGYVFEYPDGWLLDASNVDDVHIYNKEVSDDMRTCDKSLAGIEVQADISYDKNKTFDQFFTHDLWSKTPGLGSVSGKYVKQQFMERSAYNVQNAGSETPCPVSALIVDNETSHTYTAINILTSGTEDDPAKEEFPDVQRGLQQIVNTFAWIR